MMIPGTRISLHTHTARCKHAAGHPIDYCVEALRQGMDTLGFSDHAPFPDGRYEGSRMEFGELDGYLNDLRQARCANPALRVLVGFEIDFFPSLGPAFYEDLFFGRCDADYLMAGVHFLEPHDPAQDQWDDANRFDADTVRRYVSDQIAAMETGLFDVLVHPDTFTRCCPRWTPEIRAVCDALFEAALDLDVPLELNAYGLRKPPVMMPDGPRPPYPWRPFWERAAEWGVRTVIGADAHRPQDVWGNCGALQTMAVTLGLEVVNRPLADRIVRRRNDRCPTVRQASVPHVQPREDRVNPA